MKKHILSFMLVALFCSSSFAEDLYYAQSQAGGNDASSCANAKALSALTWSSGAGSIDAGDTLHLCGTITSTLTIGASGTDLSENAITVKFESGAAMSKEAWGTTTNSAIYATGKNYIIIDGNGGTIENTGNGTGLASSIASTFIHVASGTNWIVKNFGQLQNMYVRTTGAEELAYGQAIVFTPSASDVTIDNNVIHDGQKVVSITYSSGNSGIVVSNNTIDNAAVCITVGSAGTNATIDNVQIFGNTLTRGLRWSGAAAIHTDLTHTFAAHTGSSITNLQIYNNKYGGDCGTNVTVQAYVEANGGTIVAPKLYNNIFTFVASPSGSCGSGATYFKSNHSNGLIYNNTFDVGAQTAVTIGGGTGLIIKNNIFNTSGLAIAPFSSTSSVSESDYNTFLSTSDFLWGSWSQINLSTWKSTTEFDANSPTGDPSLDGNYKPQLGSIAIDNGAVLGSPYDYDKDNVARGATWDVGALEYEASADFTPAPFSPTDNTGVALSTVIYSTSIEVTGIDDNTAISISGTGCEWQVNGAGDWLTSGDNVALNDNVALRVTSAGTYSTDTPCTLTIGGVSDTWHVRTLAAAASAIPQRWRGGAMRGGRK